MGVGTGKNIIFYSGDKDITAIDISENMLKRARAQVEKLDYNCSDFIEMDIQNITFPDNLFDAVVATFVFCSVPNPVLGLNQSYRLMVNLSRVTSIPHPGSLVFPTPGSLVFPR